MKKNIIIPIIAALMSVVVAVGAALIVQDIKDDNMRYRVQVIEASTFDEYGVIYIADTKEAYMEYANHNGQKEGCDLCTRYDEGFFKTKSLIMFQVATSKLGDHIALDRIYVKDNTLIVDIYEVSDGVACAIQRLSVFIEVKKSDVENVTDSQFTVKTVNPSEFPANKKRILTNWEKEYYPTHPWLKPY